MAFKLRYGVITALLVIISGALAVAQVAALDAKGVWKGTMDTQMGAVEPGTITYEGVLSGDEMRLNVTGTTGNKMTLVARRQK